MATADQTAGVLNVGFTRGESWGLLIDFDEPANLTGYTLYATLHSTVTGASVQAITITPVDLSIGKVNLSLTSTQTASLAAGTYEFRVGWSAPTPRLVYQGFCEVRP